MSGPDFHLDSRIALDDEVLIGTIDKLAVGPAGELLVTDYTAAAVHLFDDAGRLIASVDPAACHPGFRMAPIEAFFTSDGIFLVNSGPWGFLFDLNGKCLRSPYDAFRAMPVISWDGQSHLFGYDGEDYILRMNLDGRPLDRIRLRDGARPRFPEIDRRILGGRARCNEP